MVTCAGEIALPRGASIGAIVRERKPPSAKHSYELAVNERTSEVVMAHHNTVIRPDDHVIIFVANKRMIPKVEKLFQVGSGFF